MTAGPAATLLNADRRIMPSEFAFTSGDFQAIAALLRAHSGIDLTPAKATLVYSRLAKRVRRLGLASFADYCALIDTDADERQTMVEALTTNTTSFYRERHHFDHLAGDVLPDLIAAARRGRRVRLWSSASSSGQEPYSIALTLLEAASDIASLDIRILATDLNSAMVARGAEGIYDADEIDGLPQALLKRHFERINTDPRREAYRAAPALKRMIAFRQLNLFDPWPMKGLFDVVFCRNVMIYFDADTQAGLLQRLASKIPTGGILYIGHSERISGPAANLFRQVGITTYRKISAGPT